MKLTIKCFAVVADVVGGSEAELDLVDCGTVNDLKQALVGRYPDLERLSSVLLFAVNGEYAVGGCVLRESDEVACIPPVSGG